MTAVDMMLTCDLILLARTLRAHGICTAWYDAVLSRKKSVLFRVLQLLLGDAIRHGVPQVRRVVNRDFGSTFFEIKAPELWERLQRSQGGEWLSRLDYGCPNSYGIRCGIIMIPVCTEGMLGFLFDYAGIDERWYQNGLRLSTAWQHIRALPELIAALEQDLRREAESDAPAAANESAVP